MLAPPDIPVHIDVAASLASLTTGAHVQSVSGVPVWKLAADLDRYRAVIAATRPDVLVETGTMWGGSALWFESLGVDVVTVDVDPSPVYATARASCTRTTWLVGGSTDPAVLDRVAALVAGRRVMVSLDSDHSAPHVADEIRGYGPLVSPGCYLVVEDGIFDLAATDEERARGGALVPQVGGPLRAVAELLAGDPGWRRDVEIERAYPLSYYPAGWWTRCG
jgi:cephalosporin hydroxylase